MRSTDIQLLFAYNAWANRRLLDTAEQLSTAQFVGTIIVPHLGSARMILVHLLDAEWGWRLRLQDLPDPGPLVDAQFPTLATLRSYWEAEQVELQAFLASLTDADMDRVIRYGVEGRQRVRVMWHCLAHIVTHSAQHRSELAATLTELGYSPGDLDFSDYMLVQPAPDS